MGAEFERSPRERGGVTLNTKMTKILEFLKVTQHEYNKGSLATLLKIKKSTIHVYLWKLEKAGLIEKALKDGMNYYSLPMEAGHDIPPPKEVEFHGFTLKCTTPQKCLNKPKKDEWYEDLYLYEQNQEIIVEPHLVGTTPQRKGGRWLGRMRVQDKGGRNLMVYYGSTGRPFSAAEFKAYCEGLGRRFGCDVWGGWPNWGLVQVGYGIDEVVQRHDSLPWCMTIKDFVGNVWRTYKKVMLDGTEQLRIENHPHLEEAIPVEAAVPVDLATQIQTVNASIQGGVTVMAGVNAQALFTRQVSEKIDGLVQKLDQVLGYMVEVVKQNGRRG